MSQRPNLPQLPLYALGARAESGEGLIPSPSWMRTPANLMALPLSSTFQAGAAHMATGNLNGDLPLPPATPFGPLPGNALDPTSANASGSAAAMSALYMAGTGRAALPRDWMDAHDAHAAFSLSMGFTPTSGPHQGGVPGQQHRSALERLMAASGVSPRVAGVGQSLLNGLGIPFSTSPTKNMMNGAGATGVSPVSVSLPNSASRTGLESLQAASYLYASFQPGTPYSAVYSTAENNNRNDAEGAHPNHAQQQHNQGQNQLAPDPLSINYRHGHHQHQQQQQEQHQQQRHHQQKQQQHQQQHQKLLQQPYQDLHLSFNPRYDMNVQGPLSKRNSALSDKNSWPASSNTAWLTEQTLLRRDSMPDRDTFGDVLDMRGEKRSRELSQPSTSPLNKKDSSNEGLGAVSEENEVLDAKRMRAMRNREAAMRCRLKEKRRLAQMEQELLQMKPQIEELNRMSATRFYRFSAGVLPQDFQIGCAPFSSRLCNGSWPILRRDTYGSAVCAVLSRSHAILSSRATGCSVWSWRPHFGRRRAGATH
ncbi:hypothetical protein FVE85_4266 [Porphyridium purpureum]|uniref:BZIP domain-containing protein n=1 Tax=Porphyridium purpureum TaxID=35688 RepID=A0A5J4YS06_PORPP|nr:hypothetical protein FVE85_4266 [Porphyridium purpureum]|eukprot:POR9466..scf229_5